MRNVIYSVLDVSGVLLLLFLMQGNSDFTIEPVTILPGIWVVWCAGIIIADMISERYIR